MIEAALLAVPAYLVIGLVVVAWAILLTPRDQRPDLHEAMAVALVAMICWPMLVWALFYEGPGE